MTFRELLIKTAYRLGGLKVAPNNPPPFNRQGVKKILVVRNDNLGDVIVTVPTLRALRQAFPNAYLAVLVNSYTRPVLEGIPWIDKIYSYDKHKHGKHATHLHAWFQQYQLIKELQGENFDLAIGVRSCFSTSNAHLVYASGARWRLGPAADGKKRRLAFFYNLTNTPTAEKKHEVERSLDVVRSIGIDTCDKQLEFFIPPQNKEQIDRWLTEQKLTAPLLGIQFSQRPEEGRQWSIEKYVQLIDSIRRQNKYTPVLIYAPSDTQNIQKFLPALETPISAFSSPDLKSVAALFARCNLLVTLEGGAMHISAAVGTQTIAIFGKTNKLIWRPWGDKHIVLQKTNREDEITVEEILATINRI